MTPRLANLRIHAASIDLAMQEEMSRAFPRNSRIRVKLQRNHPNAVEVLVLSYLPGGRLKVKLLKSRNDPQGGYVTSVPFEQVVR